MINQRQSTYQNREPVQTNRATFVGIERTSKFAVTQLVDKADRRTA